MADFFLSYSRRDGEVVRRVERALADRERDVWVDWDDIPDTAEWWAEVEAGIEGADAFVFVISNSSAASEVCRREFEHAQRHGKRLIPLVIEEVHPSQLPRGLADFNWIFMREQDEFEEAMRRLNNALETDLDRVRGHTRLLTRAVEWNDRGRDRNLLLRGGDLEAAEALMARGAVDPPRPTLLMGEYVSAGRQAAVRRRRVMSVAGTLILAGAATLTVIALVQRAQAIDQRRDATSRELSAAALLALETDPELSLLLATRAADVEPTEQAVEALREALVASHARASLDYGASARVIAAASPKAQRVVTVRDRGEARLWEAHTGRLLARLRGHNGIASSATFSSDGRFALTAAQDGTSRVWDARRGRKLAVLRNVHRGSGTRYTEHRLTGASFDPEARRVVTQEFPDGIVRLWDWRREQVIRDLIGHEGPTNEAVFSPDGQRLATCGQDGTARLWDASSGRQMAVLRGHGGTHVGHVAFTPDGERIVTTTNRINVFDLRTGARLMALRGHTAGIAALDVSADGTRAATASEDGTARVWDLGTGRELQVLRGHGAEVAGAAFSDNGRFVATAGRDNTARVWETRTGNPVAQLRGHRGAVLGVQWQLGSKRLLTWATDGTARIWDSGVAEPTRRQRLQVPGQATILSPRFPALRVFATALPETTRLQLRHFETGRVVRELLLPFQPSDAVVSNSGKRFVVIGQEPGEAVTGEVAGESAPRHLDVPGAPHAAAFDVDERRVLLTDEDNRATVWDVESTRRVATFGRHQGREARTAGFSGDLAPAFSSDRRTAATSDVYGTAWLWRPDNGRAIARLRATERWERMPSTAAPVFSADGRLVATTWAWEDSVRLWRASDGAKVADLERHSTTVTGATFAPRGPLLATGANDGTIRVWDSGTARNLLTLRSREGFVGDLSFSRDGRTIHAVSGLEGTSVLEIFGCDVCGTVEQLRALAKRRATRDLTDEERRQYLHE